MEKMEEEVKGEEEVVETNEAPEGQEQVAEGEEQPEGSETEHTDEPSPEEKAAAEKQGFQIKTDDKGRQYIVDEDGAEIPPQRFAKVYHEAKEGERTKEKFDLFKRLGPEAYYKAYPDEKPTDYVDPKQQTAVPQNVDVGSMRLSYPPGTPADQRRYEGMTLREIYNEDPVYAIQLQTNYYKDQEKVATEQTNKIAKFRQDSETEISTFGSSMAKELFQKETDDLTEEESATVKKRINDTIDFMTKTHRGGGILADAYRLMTMDSKLNDAKNKTAKNVVNSLRKNPVGHIGGGPSQPAADNYEALTEKQLAETVEGMSDEKKEEFYKKASPALRRKYPSWPWD
jgi:hypothetical protein